MNARKFEYEISWADVYTYTAAIHGPYSCEI